MHTPVLLEKILQQINDKSAIMVDGTIGYAGHAQAIIQRNAKITYIGFDQDSFAVNYCREKLGNNPAVHLFKDNFKNIPTYLEQLNIKKVDYFLFDLGISSVQVDQAERGFSYNKDAKLDMRMDQEQTFSAHDLVNEASLEELLDIFNNYADVKLPKVIAKAIINNRPINTTMELVKVIRECLPNKIVREKNPAKTVFQAIRIAVNDELNVLRETLQVCLKYLADKGKIMVISFHSIEDRIVKRYFGNLIKPIYAKQIPINEEKKYTVRTYKASALEQEQNKRSRSAKLRVLIKE